MISNVQVLPLKASNSGPAKPFGAFLGSAGLLRRAIKKPGLDFPNPALTLPNACCYSNVSIKSNSEDLLWPFFRK